MACRVELVADCGDLSVVSRALYINDKEDQNWLSQCCTSLSSCGSLLCFAYKDRLCLLASQWITSTESNTFIVTWSGSLPTEASALLALPIASSGLASQNGADWICIVVGFRTGEVGFYTNTGHLLLTEKLDSRPVLSIDCHTGCYGSDSDDIHVLFPNAVATLTGSSLFQTLRFAKAQLARVEAGLVEDFSLDGRSVASRKWLFVEQETVNDAVVVGLELANTFDHLLAASTYGGYETWYRWVPPHNTLVVGAGRPYVGFHYALEGGSAPPLQDVARAVASKIKSALPGWLGGGGAGKSGGPAESKVKEEALVMRSALGDTQRHASGVALSPDRRLAAVADNLGRVAVLHVRSGCLVRLFKGYRDAQCGFVQVYEQDSKRGPTINNVKETRRATFLIIYNPRKGIVDIRLMQRGSRVATFTATKNGRLLYHKHGIVGADTQRKLNLPTLQCVLLDPDGKIKKFVIPFHNALEGENSQRSKDLHVIMELKSFIKQNTFDKEDLAALVHKSANELRLPELKRHCLEVLVGYSEVPPVAVLSSLRLFKRDVEEKKPEEAKLKKFCDCLECLTLFFIHITDRDFPWENIDTHSGDCDRKSLDKETVINNTVDLNAPNEPTSSLELSESDAQNLDRLLKLAQETNSREFSAPRVTFSDQSKSAFKEFVTSFDIDGVQECLKVKDNLQPSRLSNLAALVFESAFLKNYPEPAEFETLLRVCKIDAADAVKLLITYCMDTALDKLSVGLVQKCMQLLWHAAATCEEARGIAYNRRSSWWEAVREMLVRSRCALRAACLALACREVTHRLECAGDADDGAWVSLTAERARWSLLVGRLEDIALLSIALRYDAPFLGECAPRLRDVDLEINLKYVYNHGKGSVSELVAKWLCSKGVRPEALRANEATQRESLDSTEDDDGYALSDADKACVERNFALFEWLNALRKQFPHSASADHLLANMCWEYASDWQRNVADLDKLSAAMSCLDSVADPHLCLGLCTLVWATHVRGVFEAACRLVNKVGKLPKEGLSLQDVGLGDVRKFMELCTEYLERFLSCCARAKETTKPTLKFEKIWEQSIPALVEIARDAERLEDGVLDLTYQVSCVIYYQCYFNVKTTKPLNALFELGLQRVWGGSASVEGESNGRMRAHRSRFLAKLVAAALELVACEETERGLVYRAADTYSWIERIRALAELWNIDGDFIRREQIAGLYRLGCAELAEELVGSVGSPELLLAPLTRSCALRLKRQVEISSAVSEAIAGLPPELALHLHTIEAHDTDVGAASLESSASVLLSVIRRVREEGCEGRSEGGAAKVEEGAVRQQLRLAELLVYGCDILRELDRPETD